MLITLPFWPNLGRNRTGARTTPKPYLNDEQWNLIADLFPESVMSSQGGRPRIPARQCLEGILWIMKSGARWKDLPERYPSPATCWRRHKEWVESGVFREIWKRLLCMLNDFRDIDWEEAIGDGTFAPAKKGAHRSATPRKAKERRSC